MKVAVVKTIGVLAASSLLALPQSIILVFAFDVAFRIVRNLTLEFKP